MAGSVTLRLGTDEQTPHPQAKAGKIVGIAADDEGGQALIVEIDGHTHRGDGSHYHITGSLAEGRHAKESNDVLASGWAALKTPVNVALEHAQWSR